MKRKAKRWCVRRAYVKPFVNEAMSLTTLTWEERYPARNDARLADLTHILMLPKVKKLLAGARKRREKRP